MNIIILNLHILGAGFLLAVLTFAILLLVKKPFSSERVSSIRTVINMGAWAIIWMITTGAFLFSDRPQNFVSSILFWVKIGLFIVDLIVGLILVNRKLKVIERASGSQIISSKSLVIWTSFNIIVTLIIIALSIMIAK